MNNMYGEGQNHPVSQGKLVLSNSPEGGGQPQFTNDQTSFMPAGYFQNSYMPGGAPPFATGGPGYFPPMQPEKSIFQKLRSDPVYQVLAVAIVVVLIASSVLVAFAATGMGSNPNNHANPPLAKAQATATARPTQVPTIAVPTQAPTPVPIQARQQPTQPPQDPGGTIPIQFVNPPQQGSPVQASPGVLYPITVQTQPGLTVSLTVTYEVDNSPTENYTSTADDNGIATFLWHANDAISYTQPVSADFAATAQDDIGDLGQAQATVIVV